MACRVDSDVPDALVGDCNRLRQVAVNLVSKAIKFSESLPILQDTPERKLAREALRRAHDEFGHLHPVLTVTLRCDGRWETTCPSG